MLLVVGGQPPHAGLAGPVVHVLLDQPAQPAAAEGRVHSRVGDAPLVPSVGDREAQRRGHPVDAGEAGDAALAGEHVLADLGERHQVVVARLGVGLAGREHRVHRVVVRERQVVGRVEGDAVRWHRSGHVDQLDPAGDGALADLEAPVRSRWPGTGGRRRRPGIAGRSRTPPARPGSAGRAGCRARRPRGRRRPPRTSSAAEAASPGCCRSSRSRRSPRRRWRPRTRRRPASR